MDELKSYGPKKNSIPSGSVLRKGGVIGAITGALSAIAIHVYSTFVPIHFGDSAFFLVSLIQAPAFTICKAMGLTINSSNFALLLFCVSIVTTSLLGAIVGVAIGNLFKKPSTKK